MKQAESGNEIQINYVDKLYKRTISTGPPDHFIKYALHMLIILYS